MNKKGFTLAEMLAVIVILGIIGTITITSITAVQRKTNISMIVEKVQLAVDSAVKHYEKKENKSEVTNGKTVTAQKLIDDKIFTTEEVDASGKKALINPFDNSSMNNLEICVTTKYQRVYACVLKTDSNYNLLKDVFTDETAKFDGESEVAVNFICDSNICK